MAHNPYAIKLELVRGCTARCPFCALRHMEWVDEPYEYMAEKTFVKIMEDLKTWLPKFRLEFANRGEPTLHPKLVEFTKIAREVNPQCQILLTSNTDLSKKNGMDWYVNLIKSFYEAGGNVVLLDCYVANRYKDVSEAFESRHDDFPFIEYFFGESEFNPYYYRKPKFKALVIKDASVENGSTKENAILHYHNQGGNASVNMKALKIWRIKQIDEPMEKMCVRPFRELTIHYDGTVPICCDDWREQAVISHVKKESLKNIWFNSFNKRRKQLLNKDRSSEPCNKCTVGAGSRVGLEMNWFEE